MTSGGQTNVKPKDNKIHYIKEQGAMTYLPVDCYYIGVRIMSPRDILRGDIILTPM
jgi:hypothetical protein